MKLYPDLPKRGKELLINTFKGIKNEKVPWVPFAGVHAGKLIGCDAIEVLTDSERLKKALTEVIRLYRPDGMPITFDLQLEAEILGCKLMWDKKAPPSVRTHPLAEKKEIPAKLPSPEDGRFPIVLEVMKYMSKNFGNEVAFFGLVTGPLTLASHLRGTNFFMDMIEDPEYASSLLEYAKNVALKVKEFYIGSGMDVIAVVDPLVSQISPRHFKKLLLTIYTDIFTEIRKEKRNSAFFVCGDATKNIEVMCQSKPDAIFIDENVDMKEAKGICEKYEVALGGNIPLTTVMLYGTQQDNMKYVVDMLDSLESNRLIIAPGCDMPYDTPPENVIAIQQAIKEPESVREMLKNYIKVEEEDDIELPDYANLGNPL
ncbi:uroporphyrinogen decarboxylase family protein [Kosmotoga arenicorallina]|uniref:uroporphyrinogen decarboxylase family protein n=1 Tax=Kosmotoga arenicorallina TaxID=688066 RepID=UPI000B077EF7|nr:uroporphyrinogen decarboxylase family protein [Kosmotoga arenicorallina]